MLYKYSYVLIMLCIRVCNSLCYTSARHSQNSLKKIADNAIHSEALEIRAM